MRRNMDAFIAAAENARARLIRAEGANVSWREVIRRADRMDKRGTIMHHLNPRKWENGNHRVPPEVIQILADVLPTSADQLTRAAQVAAGYNVLDQSRPDVTIIARYLGNDEVSDEEKAEVIQEVLRIVTERIGRRGVPVVD